MSDINFPSRSELKNRIKQQDYTSSIISELKEIDVNSIDFSKRTEKNGIPQHFSTFGI